jgi:hypothetical protein
MAQIDKLRRRKTSTGTEDKYRHRQTSAGTDRHLFAQKEKQLRTKKKVKYRHRRHTGTDGQTQLQIGLLDKSLSFTHKHTQNVPFQPAYTVLSVILCQEQKNV